MSERFEPVVGGNIPNHSVRRLSLYLRQLEAMQADGRDTVSSKMLGDALSFTDAQVRKDLAHFGQFGYPGVGYRVGELIRRLKQILGTDRKWPTILVGAGNLGRALLSHRGFEAKGFEIAGVFDGDPSKIGTTVATHTIRPMSELSDVIESGASLAIIAVPGNEAQSVVDQLVTCGIRGILSFAPVLVTAPAGIPIQQVDLAVAMEQLVFQVQINKRLTEKSVRV